MNKDEHLIEHIRRLHSIYYNTCWGSKKADFMLFHRELEFLFNYAEINSSRVDLNPNEVKMKDWLEQNNFED